MTTMTVWVREGVVRGDALTVSRILYFVERVAWLTNQKLRARGLPMDGIVIETGDERIIGQRGWFTRVNIVEVPVTIKAPTKELAEAMTDVISGLVNT